jgi:hypothetical protein
VDREGAGIRKAPHGPEVMHPGPSDFPTRPEASVQPTIGRIVHYTLSEQDAAIINRRRAGRAARDRIDVATLGSRVEGGDVLPATVVRVWPTSCNLQVTLDGSDAYWATSRSEGDRPGAWSWPPRG